MLSCTSIILVLKHAALPANGGLMICHPVRTGELEDCLALHPASLGYELVGEHRAHAAWRVMLSMASFHSAVVENPDSRRSSGIVGFGAAVFVSNVFAAKETSTPEPGLNSRVIASLCGPRPVILDEHSIRKANATGGLDVIVLASTWKQEGLTLDQIAEVQARLAASFLEVHLGYRLNRMLFEATDAREIQYTQSTQAYRLHTSFEDFRNPHHEGTWNADRALFVLTRQEAMAATGSIASLLFEPRQPRLMLHSSDQQLVEAALKGRTDPELALELNVTVAAIKKRWLALYERVGRLQPELLNESGECSRSTRGRQKKHRVVAYLRDHPEELKPFGLRSGSGRTPMLARAASSASCAPKRPPKQL